VEPVFYAFMGVGKPQNLYQNTGCVLRGESHSALPLFQAMEWWLLKAKANPQIHNWIVHIPYNQYHSPRKSCFKHSNIHILIQEDYLTHGGHGLIWNRLLKVFWCFL